MSAAAPLPSRKPQIPILTGGAVSLNPGKNYAYQLLFHHIEALTPRRGLDAGVGELRNFSMFPGHYVGITVHRKAYFEGVAVFRDVIKAKGPPEVYLMRLESDFSFIAPVDLAVCTFTLEYLEDPADVVKRLADRVNKGGSVILSDDIAMAERTRALLADDFEKIEMVYFCHERDMFVDDLPILLALTKEEMASPNTPEGHANFYLLATGKKTPPGPQGPRPAITDDNGLHVVDKDVPRMVEFETAPQQAARRS